MKDSGKVNIQTLIQNFFLSRLMEQKNVSPKTVESYRDSFKLYFEFLQANYSINILSLNIDHFSHDYVLEYLKYLEVTRHNQAITINNRLSAIHSFLKYVSEMNPEYSDIAYRSLLIPFKKHTIKTFDYITKDEFQYLLKVCDTKAYLGERDKLMLLLMYNTGIRVSELISIKYNSIVGLENNSKNVYLKILGKGRKQRTIPLWDTTTEYLHKYINDNHLQPDDYIFESRIHGPLTRSGVRFRIEKLVELASKECISLKQKNISPHTFRHSVAMNLLQAGVDVSTVAIWLGHSSIETTHKYMVADLELKRKAMAKAGIINTDQDLYHPTNDLLEFLSRL